MICDAAVDSMSVTTVGLVVETNTHILGWVLYSAFRVCPSRRVNKHIVSIEYIY